MRRIEKTAAAPVFRRLSRFSPQIMFLLTVILSVFTTYYVSCHYIDSDASSELVLAHQLSQTGQILSKDWFYSTELRVLNTQLIYAPLFLLFDEWHLVRFSGALILQAILVLSYGFLFHEMALPKRTFYLSASLLLLPVSVCYGRIVLYHCYYIPHIALSFLLLGLILGFPAGPDRRSVKACLRLLLLLGLSFLGGLGGVRQLMITHAPILLSILVFCLLEDSRQSDETCTPALLSKDKLSLLLVSVAAAVASFAGLVINVAVLRKVYTIGADQSTITLGFLDAASLDDLLYGFFHQFGFRTDVKMISLSGLLSIGSIFTGAYILILSVKKVLAYQKGDDVRQAVFYAFFLFHTAVMLVVFLISGKSQDYYFPLYLSLCYPWSIALFLANWKALPEKLHPFHAKKLFAWVSILVLLLSGGANFAYFHGSTAFSQVYEGLHLPQRDKKELLTELASYLCENDYEIGYATFREGNILTEMTDGNIQIINIECDVNQSGNLSYYNWLTSLWLREVPNQKPFLVLDAYYKPYFEESDSYPYCTLIYENCYCCAYAITDLEQFIPTLYY